MLSNLIGEVQAASKSAKILAGFNIFGAEDAIAVINAAEKRSAPVMLMLNKDAVKSLPMESWVGMLLPLIKKSSVPIGLHLDHCSVVEDVLKAVSLGFSSVMYDGSQLPLEQNIENTNIVAKEAIKRGVALEGEIGSVPYSDIPGRAKDICTSSNELSDFARQGEADWIAVAVGQVHRMQVQSSVINFDSLEGFSACTDKPLVIHGGSGIKKDDIIKMLATSVGKINVGTALRMSFFKTLQEDMLVKKDNYDRAVLFEGPIKAVEKSAMDWLELLGY